ncbi:MAG: glycosyltransferase 87 family protein [Chloroflexota bacterium]
MTSTSQSLRPLNLLGDFRLLVILFLGFRIMLLMVYQPLLIDPNGAEPGAVRESAEVLEAETATEVEALTGVERGVGAMGDRLYHYTLSAYTARGDWPFVDWWSEFPPVWYTLTTAVYQLLGENVDYSSWSIWMGIILILFDLGNLILMRRIGTRLYGPVTGMGLAWIYALTLAPMVFGFWNFEPMVAFFLLLGLDWLLRKEMTRSAVAIAIGALTKFTPVLLVGALIRFRPPREAARWIAIVLAIFAGVYALLYFNNAASDADPDMVTVSLTAQFGKASYQTVWALIDGNYTTGNFGAPETHYDPAAADILYGEPPVIPAIVRLALAGAVGLFVFWRTRRFDDRGLVAFVAITVLIFFLQAQGWSPQWLAQILPLVLLAFPTRNGVLVTVLLSFLTFSEYPLLFIRTGDTGGVVEGALRGPFAALIIGRTLLLVAICVALYGVLRQEPVPDEGGA